MLQCSACSSELRKLRQLPCCHGVCNDCLTQLVVDGAISCPQCQESHTLSTLGVRDYPVQFAGDVECGTCKAESPIRDSTWCENCQDLVCGQCKTAEAHTGHLFSVPGHIGPLNYSIKVIEKYSELHTNLCQMQKGIVQEYFMKTQDAILKMLDEDLKYRLDKFKTEKQHLEQAFDTAFATTVDSSGFMLNGNKYVHFVRKLHEIADMKNCRKPSELATNTGVVFKPPHVDKLVEQLTDMGGNIIAGSSVSYRKLMPSTETKMPVVMFLGSGVLTHPCDLAVLPKIHQLAVTSTNSGIVALQLGSGEVVNRVLSKANQQFVCVEHCLHTGKVFVACLEDSENWKIRIFSDGSFAQEEDCTSCPTEPKIGSSWYRWLTVVNENFLLLSTGDKTVSALHLFNRGTKAWSLVHQEEGSTYRRAAVRDLGNKSTMVYVPDMQKTKIRTFTLNNQSGELTGFAHIAYDELDRGIPVAIDVFGDVLVIGLWLTGNIVHADLKKGSSKTIASVGARELLSLRIVENKLYALRKKLEVVEVYNFSRFQ